MHLISWAEIDFRNGRVYNNVLNTYPSFVHFNGGVWQTQTKENIMPVFVEKINASKQTTDIHTLNEYEQIITRTSCPDNRRETLARAESNERETTRYERGME